MTQAEIYDVIEAELRAGRCIVQATVIEARGSTPRKEGATMLVKSDGRLAGTVGGGCGEAGVIRKAMLSLEDGQHREELADLTEEISREASGVCGGTFRVFLEPWIPGPEAIALSRSLAEIARAGRHVSVHRVVDPAGAPGVEKGARLVLAAGGERLLPPDGLPLPEPVAAARKPCALTRSGPCELFTERWEQVPELILVGAGHVAEALEGLARAAGWQTVVVDDRAAFASRARFPAATSVLTGSIVDIVRQLPLTAASYVVLVTRGHALDMDALKVLLERDVAPAYIGMIGSRRRVRAVFDLLASEGCSRERLARVRAPIGLHIAAETPAEIAVSILAEMIAVRRHAGSDTRPMSERR